jgi:hypothetical protein
LQPFDLSELDPMNHGFHRPGRVLAALALAAAAAAPARGQIYYVTFKDARTAKRFPSACITLPDGRPALAGEAKSGIVFSNGRINYQGGKSANELWAVNTADPALVPYKLSGDAYVAAGVKGGIASLSGDQIEQIQFLLPKQSLYGMAREYALRKRGLEALQKSRDSTKAGSPEWSTAHARLLGEMERLRTWLDTTCYPEAAKKLAAEIEKQRKTVAKEAYAQRLASALASVALVPAPAKLVELGKSLAPATEFHVQESRHLRFTYDTRLTDEQVKELLELAEKMVDGFRAEFVDPYVGDGFEDGIPEQRFMEFWFGPDDLAAHERFLVDWYDVTWGDHKAERVAAMSGRYRRKEQPEYLDYWKILDNKDFDAIVAHQLGHVLANLHWNAGRKGDLPAWIEEAAGYWLALSYLGKNGVTCKEFTQQQYAKPAARQIERSILLGESELFTRIALEHGAPADQLLRKPLHQMEDADLAKSWSFFEWVGRAEGKRGQLWLRALCEVFSQAGPSLVQFREKSEQSFGVQPGEDVFKILDERWRRRAEELQRTGAEPRGK